jgi:hypothetical protein
MVAESILTKHCIKELLSYIDKEREEGTEKGTEKTARVFAAIFRGAVRLSPMPLK